MSGVDGGIGVMLGISNVNIETITTSITNNDVKRILVVCIFFFIIHFSRYTGTIKIVRSARIQSVYTITGDTMK